MDLRQYLNNKGVKNLVTPKTTSPKKPTTAPTSFSLPATSGATTQAMAKAGTGKPVYAYDALRWVGKQLMKPVGSVVATTEQLGKASQPILSGKATPAGQGGFQEIKKIPGEIGAVWSGEKEKSFSSLWQENLSDHPYAALAIGLTLDIVADPLTYVGGGLTKEGELASKVTGLTKAGEKIQAGSKLGKQIAKSGKTVEELTLGATKAEQAAKGQRAFLQFAGKSVLPKAANEAIYKTTGAAGQKIAPFLTGIRKAFSTKTTNQDFNQVIQHFRDLGDYRAAKVLEEARDIQKAVMGMTPDEIIDISNYLEKGKRSSDKVNAIGDRLQNLYKGMKELEVERGIRGGDIAAYAPHIRPKESLGQRINNFLTAKEWSTGLGGAEKGRKVLRFTSETGDELIGTAEKLGLKPVDNISGLAHDITTGEFRTFKEVESTLKKYGYQLVFKPKEFVSRRGVLGYFDPVGKKVVVASKHPLNQVISTLQHEVTHNAHFQFSGQIAMLETMAKTGRRAKAFKGQLEMLKNAKKAAASEWKNILATTLGTEPKNVAKVIKQMKQEPYYRSYTELLAYAMQEVVNNPVRAKMMYPKTFAALRELQMSNNKLFTLTGLTPRPGGMQITGALFRDKAGRLFQSALASIDEVNYAFQTKFFETNPALQFAHRGLAHAKAVTSQEFFDNVRQFAVKEGGVPSTAPELAGLHFEPEVAAAIDNYRQALKPEEMKVMFKAFDAVQNWWKSQALIAPAYHLRNSVSNLWNKFLAGQKSPVADIMAGQIQMGKKVNFIDDIGRVWDEKNIRDLAERTGVINQGWYAADIPTAIGAELQKTIIDNVNPLSQNNVAFELNKKIGTAIENNARLGLFIDQLKKGYAVDEAAMTVKKFLFDYKDLTVFERNVMKRIFPFYTWTRKNIPLQLENLIRQPGKFAGLEKVVRSIESVGMRGAPPANEKYLSDYITSNSSMRVKYNKEDDTYYYFLLGSWMPSYQALDVLSQPLDTFMQMLTPMVKTPMSMLFNNSLFFKDTLGTYDVIERYPGDMVNFLGINMPKKTATILRNLRILNDLDKLNPGEVFGGEKGEPSVWKKMNMPAVDVPVVGTLSPATEKYPKTTPSPSAAERAMGWLTGKLQAYKPDQAKEYYRNDTDDRVREFEKAIEGAKRKHDMERAKELERQKRAFIKERGR